MSAFSEMLNDDLDAVFIDREAFGNAVVLVRGSDRFPMNGLYDAQALEPGEPVGPDVAAISHRPRLVVRKVDLPGQVARKGDVFEIETKSGFQKFMKLKAVDFADESDGTITYQLELVKKTQPNVQ